MAGQWMNLIPNNKGGLVVKIHFIGQGSANIQDPAKEPTVQEGVPDFSWGHWKEDRHLRRRHLLILLAATLAAASGRACMPGGLVLIIVQRLQKQRVFSPNI
eukprot:865032-Pelagomonas_calceolata.AAC.2